MYKRSSIQLVHGGIIANQQTEMSKRGLCSKGTRRSFWQSVVRKQETRGGTIFQ
jgi:hypothetical protein